MAATVNRLTYFIDSGILRGVIGDEHFKLLAESGGGRGSGEPGRRESSLASFDPRKPKTGDSIGQRGGVIPPGLWWVYPPQWKDNPHDHLGLWVSYLKPVGNQAKQFPKRNFDPGPGFYIHGTGKKAKGSDGCLVIDDGKKRRHLLLAVEKVGGVALEVSYSDKQYSPADLLRYIERDGWREA